MNTNFNQPALLRASQIIIALAVGAAAMTAIADCNPPQIDRLIAFDAATGDNFGWSAAMSDDTIVIGALLDGITGVGANAGSAHVFIRNGSRWDFQSKLTPSVGEPGGWFGQAVAISGNTCIVGAEGSESAYVFVRTGTFWAEQARLIAADATTLTNFGTSVAVSGDTVLVGANHDHDSGNDAGAAYVFVRTGTTWTQQAKLKALDGGFGDLFGSAVAMSGDSALIGAYADDLPPSSSGGSAYVFVRNGSTWTQQACLVPLDHIFSDQFGWAIAIAGNTAAISSHTDTHPGQSFAGSAYIFTRSGTAWTQQAKLTASDGLANDRFGQSIAVSNSGNSVAVGAWFDDHAGGTDAGSLYVFLKPEGGWTTMTETAKVTASDAAASDFLGHSVAVSDDYVVGGANRDNHFMGPADAGSAYVFDFSDCQPAPCVGDFDTGGDVDGIDLAVLLGQWTGAATYAPCPPHRPSDLNQDCKVNGLDLAMLLAGWGPCS